MARKTIPERYEIWDKTSPIYTPGRDAKGKSVWTAEEWLALHAWAAREGAKAIVSKGTINGMVFMEFEQVKRQAIANGAQITADMTDNEVLAALEEFEDTPVVAGPTAEERIAAMLEFQVMLSLPEEV